MTYYGVKDLCKRFAVGEHTILGWVKRGELRSIDVSRRGKQGARPKWRFTEAAVAEFELSRTPSPPPDRTRRRKQATETIEFYK